jgi:gas vesicle protein
MNSGKAFLGVLVGITAGAALGILFAPEKGSNTRKKIVKKGEDLANTLDEKIDEKFGELMNAINSKVKKNRSQNATVSSTAQDIED